VPVLAFMEEINALTLDRFRIFLSQCQRRQVRLMPQGMAKRKQNTSYYSIKSVYHPYTCAALNTTDVGSRDDIRFWRVEWRFPCISEDTESRLFSER